MRIACLFTHGFEETELVTVADCLIRAGIEVDLVSLSDQVLKGSHGLCLTADKAFEEMYAYDGIFLPGGPQISEVENDGRVLDLVRSYVNQDKWVLAICAAPRVLAKSGVLKDRQATSFPASYDKDLFEGCDYLEDRVVQDGKIVTSRAMGTALEFGVALVGILGYDADKLAESILYKG